MRVIKLLLLMLTFVVPASTLNADVIPLWQTNRQGATYPSVTELSSLTGTSFDTAYTQFTYQQLYRIEELASIGSQRVSSYDLRYFSGELHRELVKYLRSPNICNSHYGNDPSVCDWSKGKTASNRLIGLRGSRFDNAYSDEMFSLFAELNSASQLALKRSANPASKSLAASVANLSTFGMQQIRKWQFYGIIYPTPVSTYFCGYDVSSPYCPLTGEGVMQLF